MLAASELPALLQQYYWPFVRMSALFLAAPILGASTFPVRARILLALGATVLIAPALPAVVPVDVLSVEGVLLGAQQVIIGFAMGFIVQLVFSAAVIAGQRIVIDRCPWKVQLVEGVDAAPLDSLVHEILGSAGDCAGRAPRAAIEIESEERLWLQRASTSTALS